MGTDPETDAFLKIRGSEIGSCRSATMNRFTWGTTERPREQGSFGVDGDVSNVFADSNR